MVHRFTFRQRTCGSFTGKPALDGKVLQQLYFSHLSLGARLPAHAVGEHPHQPDQLVEVFAGPIPEQGKCHLFPRHIEGICCFLPPWRDDRLTHPLVGRARATLNEFKRLKTRNLTANGRVVAPNTLGQFYNADRPPPLDSHEKRKKRSFECQSGHFQQLRVTFRTVHKAADVDKRAVQLGQHSFDMCILHFFC